jgi:hypothetical protein
MTAKNRGQLQLASFKHPVSVNVKLYRVFPLKIVRERVVKYETDEYTECHLLAFTASIPSLHTYN